MKPTMTCGSDDYRHIMRAFSLSMIQKLVNESSFYRAYTETMQALGQSVKKEKIANIKWVEGDQEARAQKLFDMTSQDAKLRISDGPIEDESPMDGPTNVEITYGPFIGR